MQTRNRAFLFQVIALIVTLAILLSSFGNPVNAKATKTIKLIGPEGLTLYTPWAGTHWDNVWDLSRGDLTLSYTIDMNNFHQPGSWDTYNGTTAYAEVGLRGEGPGDYNPGTAWDAYQGSCGGWMLSGGDAWIDSDGFTENGNLPNSIYDKDDKHQLQASGQRNERDYDVLLSNPNFVGPTRQDPWYPGDPTKVIGAYGSFDSVGIWWDRDGVAPNQSATYANTQGIYHIVLTYHAINEGLGVMFATINGLPQGFYAEPANWDGNPEYYPAGLSFKGDMKHMVVFAGLWGPNYEAWALQAYGDHYKLGDGYYFNYGTVTLRNMTVEGIPGKSDPLVADFKATVGQGNVFRFDASTTHGGMPPYTYQWDFNNDGTVDKTTTSPVTSHTFTSAPPYTVKLTVVPYRCIPQAVVKKFWYGFPAGYWKSHPKDWAKAGYSKTVPVMDVFTIPGDLMAEKKSNPILDLDGNGKNDTLFDALNYKGDETLAGSTRILLREATAALLNESALGAYFPPYNSATALISVVDTTLAILDPSSYTTLATELDSWNNGMEFFPK